MINEAAVAISKSRVDETHIRELAEFFRRLRHDDEIVLGPTDRDLVPIGLENLARLMRAGFIGPMIEV